MMKHLSALLLALTGGTQDLHARPQAIDPQRSHAVEEQLADVMELADTVTVKAMLAQVEQDHASDPSTVNRVRLAIVHHEVALNLTFLSKTAYKGHAKKSYDLLTELEAMPLAPEWMPYVASYRASALSLVAGETRKLSLVGDAFVLFEKAVQRYGADSYVPEFLRGSVAENLPWIFHAKKKFAARDFTSIITKQEQRPGYANDKIMSYTYWAWANTHQRPRYRQQALGYLAKALDLDPDGNAARTKAEALLEKWK